MQSNILGRILNTFTKVRLGIVLSLVLLLVITQIVMQFGNGPAVQAAGGAYNLDWSAADAKQNSGQLLPTYPKVGPATLACPAPSGSTGRATNPLVNAVYALGTASKDKEAVESLAPADMTLGQIVPFELQIDVSGRTTPENGKIKFTPYWNTMTTSGDNFGYEPTYGVYCAFVDSADAGNVDSGNNAKVDSYSYSIVNAGTKDEQIQGNIQVSGLDNGDKVIVELWAVLKNSKPAGASGNVHAGMLSAQTTSGDTINVGNQTIPLLKIGDFVDQPTTNQNCTYTQGYWVNHPSNWPTVSLTIGGSTYTEEEALAVIATNSSYGTPFVVIQQMMAAKLNIAQGATKPSEVTTALTTVENYLAKYNKLVANTTPVVKSGQTVTAAEAQAALDAKTVLDKYNNGLIGPGHCGSTTTNPTDAPTATTAPTRTPAPATNTPVPTNTSVPPTATSVPPTAVPPTATSVPPTAVPPTATSVPPTAVPPTATSVPPTAVPPTATSVPPTAVPPTATSVPPTAVPPTATSVPPTAVPPTATSVPPTAVPPTDTPIVVQPTNTPSVPTNTPMPTATTVPDCKVSLKATWYDSTGTALTTPPADAAGLEIDVTNASTGTMVCTYDTNGTLTCAPSTLPIHATDTLYDVTMPTQPSNWTVVGLQAGFDANYPQACQGGVPIEHNVGFYPPMNFMNMKAY